MAAPNDARLTAANASTRRGPRRILPFRPVEWLGWFSKRDVNGCTIGPVASGQVKALLSIPLFEGGLLRANLRQAKAVYDQNVANYRQNVLMAFAEVEDNLAAQQLLASENEAETAALQSAQKTLDIANNRYRAGLVTYLEVATAQNAALDLERSSVLLHGDQLVATVALIKSLGGGWTLPPQAALKTH